MDADGVMARRRVEFYLLGAVLRRPVVFGKISIKGCAGASARICQTYLYDGVCYAGMGIFLFSEYGKCVSVYRPNVWYRRPRPGRCDGGILSI